MSLRNLLALTTTALAAAAAAAQETTTQDPALRIMVIGASISAGMTGGGVLTNGYREPLLDRLVDDGWSVDYVGTQTSGTMVDNHHEGYPGIRTQPLADQTRRKAVVSTFLPNLLLLNVGTNDCTARINSTEARRVYSDMIDAIFEPAYPDGHERLLVVSTLLPRRGTDEGQQRCTAEFNDQVRDLVLTHPRSGSLALADMNTGFITVDDLAEGDDLHPNAGGFDKMADVFFAAFKDNTEKLIPA